MRKFLLIWMTLVVSFSMCVPTFAASIENGDVRSDLVANTDEFNINDYIQYTIHLNENSVVTRSVEGNTIDEAVSYVESLNLSDMGYSYIEAACLSELFSYKDDDVELENYTVLIPKARTKKLFGTYAGQEYYYENTSIADFRRDTIGAKKSASNATKWNNWMLGASDLAMCFANAKWAVGYSLIRTVTGISNASEVHYNSYNKYVEQFTGVVTRSIYKKRGTSNYDLSYQDQSGNVRINMYFCPVGKDAKQDFILIKTVMNQTIKANTMTKSEILKLAATNANHGIKSIYKMTTSHVEEKW